MPAVYCGSKRSYSEDDTPSPPSKRFRCYSPSNSPTSSLLDQLRTAFPHLDLTVLVKAIEVHGSDAMKSLYSLVSAKEKEAEELATGGGTGGTFTACDNPPTSGDDWAELLVREVTEATGTNDAKLRTTKVLEGLEKILSARAREEAEKAFIDEKMRVEQQIEALVKENTVLKRAVAIQHERQKGLEEEKQQLEVLKHVITQYQEKLRTLEVNNYALRMQLQQVFEPGNSMPDRFNPHVF